MTEQKKDSLIKRLEENSIRLDERGQNNENFMRGIAEDLKKQSDHDNVLCPSSISIDFITDANESPYTQSPVTLVVTLDGIYKSFHLIPADPHTLLILGQAYSRSL